MAPRSKGIVIPISSTDDTGRAFQSVNAQVDELRKKVSTLQANLRGGGPGQTIGEGMQHAVPQVAAASGAIREFEGSLPIRAVERFLTSTLNLGPVLQAAFPLVGAIAFAGVITENVNKLLELSAAGFNAPEVIARAFRDMVDKIQQGNSELDLAIAKTQQNLDKLTGKHNDGLQVTLANARVEADKLYTSLKEDLKALNALTKEKEIGFLTSLVSPESGTEAVTNEIARSTKALQDQQDVIKGQYEKDLKAAGNNRDAKLAAEKKYQDDSNRNFDQFISQRGASAEQLRKQESDARKPFAAATGFLNEAGKSISGFTGTDQLGTSLLSRVQPSKGAGINLEEGAANVVQAEKDRFNRTGKLSDLQEEVEGAKGAKNDHRAEQKAEAERRAKAEADEKTAAAERDLAEAQARALAAQQKAQTDTELDQLESAHRALLVSDEDYYRQREAIQSRAIANQRAAVAAERAGLSTQADAATRSGTGLTGNDKTVNDAKIVELRAKIVDLDIKDAQLTGEAAKNTRTRADAETDLAKKRLAAADQIAAQLEGERGGSVVARQQQSRDQFQQRRAAAGSDPAVLANLDTQQGIDQDTIGARGADQDFGAGESGRKIARTSIDDQLRRGQITAQDAQRQKIALDKQEADAMQPLLAAYQKLAADGDLAAIDKVAELQQKIAELKNPVNEVAAEIRSQLDSAFEGFFENLARGRHALRSLGEAIQKDATKDAYQQFIRPALQSAEGILVPNRGAGKLPSGGGFGAAFGGILNKVPGFAGAGKKGDGQQVVVKIENQSSTPVSADTANASFDGDSWVVGVVLKNLSEGGSLAKAFSIG